VGTGLAVRAGTKSVVTAGLVLLGSAFLWISTASTATPYSEIIGQMVLLGAGLGLTSAPAIESIMDVAPREKAGVGSAVNDATRELGATLGVAVTGSVSASLYTHARLQPGRLGTAGRGARQRPPVDRECAHRRPACGGCRRPRRPRATRARGHIRILRRPRITRSYQSTAESDRTIDGSGARFPTPPSMRLYIVLAIAAC
jgi:hypothetical protein